MLFIYTEKICKRQSHKFFDTIYLGVWNFLSVKFATTLLSWLAGGIGANKAIVLVHKLDAFVVSISQQFMILEKFCHFLFILLVGSGAKYNLQVEKIWWVGPYFVMDKMSLFPWRGLAKSANSAPRKSDSSRFSLWTIVPMAPSKIRILLRSSPSSWSPSPVQR